MTARSVENNFSHRTRNAAALALLLYASSLSPIVNWFQASGSKENQNGKNLVPVWVEEISTPADQSCEFIVTGKNLTEDTIIKVVKANKRTAIANNSNEDTLTEWQILESNQADYKTIKERGFFAIPYPSDGGNPNANCASPVEGNVTHTPPKDFLRPMQDDEQLWVTTNFSPNIPIERGITVRYLVTDNQGQIGAFPMGTIEDIDQKTRTLRLKTNGNEILVPARAIFVQYHSIN